MRNVAFLGVSILLLVLQGNLYRVLGRIPVPGITPNLLLPMIVFMGVHEFSLVRGAALAFVLGYVLDLFAVAPIGLFTFVSVATFVIARLAGVRLAAQTTLTQLALALGFATAWDVIAIVMVAIFGKSPYAARAMAASVVPHALATAALSPLVFRLAERLHQATISVPRFEGGPRA